MITWSPALADGGDQRVGRGHAGGEGARVAALELPQRVLQRAARRVRRARVVVVLDELARRGLDVGRRLVDGGDDAAVARVGLQAGVDGAGRELRHETSASSRSARVTMPVGRPCSVTSSAWRSPREQLHRLAHRVGRGHRRERRLHHVDDALPHQLRVVRRVLEQPALADRADDGARVGVAHDRAAGRRGARAGARSRRGPSGPSPRPRAAGSPPRPAWRAGRRRRCGRSCARASRARPSRCR